MHECQLVVFVKAPRAGFVKTRLAETVGTETALEAYLSLVEVLIGKLKDLPHVDLCFTPADALAEIKPWLQPGWTATPQCDGDLGARMQSAVENGLNTAQRVVVIGSDCPYLDSRDIGEAKAALEQHDLVLGPATDGGYWLIGMKAPQPEVFRGITWSSDSVLSDTLRIARENNLKISELRELPDVDTVADFIKFHEWHILYRAKADSGFHSESSAGD